MIPLKKLTLFALLLSFIFPSYLSAQVYEAATENSVMMTVTGTSTLHGWTVTANEVKDVPSSITISDEKTIDDFRFGVVINSMDGGRGATMNTKIKNALQATEHPVITYEQSETAKITDQQEDGTFTLVSKGVLKMVGQEKPVSITVQGQQTAEGLILKGSHPLTFSEFDIEPPSAMFGQIVCGDDIAVNFEFKYSK
ncbi:MAG: YceI family protein [Bacteroidota bacterium]